tara:strand:+ start:179 stop:766 length:588 start_codon:yes stop_codon:yes gene_type:complete
MKFEDMQVVWNSQTERPAFQFDESALIDSITQRHRSFVRLVGFFDWAMMLCLLFVGVMCLRDPLLQGHDLFLVLPAIGCLIGAMFVWKGRKARLGRAGQYEDSLLGLVEKSIAQIDAHVSRLRTMHWWCILPLTFTLLVGFSLVDDDRRHLFYFVFAPLFAICIGLSYWGMQREVRCDLLPKRADLELLREKILA